MDREAAEVGTLEQVARSAQGTLSAVGRLAESELELAGAALLRSALYAIIASGCLASASIMTMALVVAGLLAVGLPWQAAVAVAGLLALLLAIWFARRARQLLGHCGMPASRRQLAALLAYPPNPPVA